MFFSICLFADLVNSIKVIVCFFFLSFSNQSILSVSILILLPMRSMYSFGFLISKNLNDVFCLTFQKCYFFSLFHFQSSPFTVTKKMFEGLSRASIVIETDRCKKRENLIIVARCDRLKLKADALILMLH